MKERVIMRHVLVAIRIKGDDVGTIRNVSIILDQKSKAKGTILNDGRQVHKIGRKWVYLPQ